MKVETLSITTSRLYPGCYFLYAGGRTYRARREGRKWLLFSGESEASVARLSSDLSTLRACKAHIAEIHGS